MNTLKLLKPGGVSVHTTEYNISSEENIDIPYLAVFGKRFFDELCDEITSEGHYFAPLDLRLGNSPEDDYVYSGGLESHYKMIIGGAVATSIGIFIKKKE